MLSSPQPHFSSSKMRGTKNASACVAPSFSCCAFVSLFHVLAIVSLLFFVSPSFLQEYLCFPSFSSIGWFPNRLLNHIAAELRLYMLLEPSVLDPVSKRYLCVQFRNSITVLASQCQVGLAHASAVSRFLHGQHLMMLCAFEGLYKLHGSCVYLWLLNSSVVITIDLKAPKFTKRRFFEALRGFELTSCSKVISS